MFQKPNKNKYGSPTFFKAICQTCEEKNIMGERSNGFPPTTSLSHDGHKKGHKFIRFSVDFIEALAKVIIPGNMEKWLDIFHMENNIF